MLALSNHEFNLWGKLQCNKSTNRNNVYYSQSTVDQGWTGSREVEQVQEFPVS